MSKKSRSKSSSDWLNRQHSDPYVRKAKEEGYRSRSAYKLLELQQKDRILRPGMRVVDLGAAPGGWSQVASKCVGKGGSVFALDLLPMDSLEGVDIVLGNFEKQEVFETLTDRLQGKEIDLVISDMAPNLSGVAISDQARSIALAEVAFQFAQGVLAGNGMFLVKLFQGVGFSEYHMALKAIFKEVMIRKPKASRADSKEVYLLAKGCRKHKGHLR